MNVYLLEQIKMAIEAEPAQFVMARWFSGPRTIADNYDLPRKIPNCGTAACIAGWAYSIRAERTPAEARDLVMGSAVPLVGAERLLAVSPRQFSRLCHVSGWPEHFREGWMKEATLEGRARIACDRIDWFIATDGRE